MVGLDDRSLKESPAWGHMSRVVAQLAAERPKNALAVVDAVSTFITTGRPVPESAPSVFRDGGAAKQLVAADAAKDTEWAARFGLQLVPPKPAKRSADGEEEAEAEDAEAEEDSPGEAVAIPDIVAEQLVFGLFGEGLPEVEAFRVLVALRRLADKEPLAKVRLWGKITGIHRDYYICEAKIDDARVPETDAVEEEAPEQVGKPPETIFEALNTYRARTAPRVLAEESGKGVNEFVYYVATSDDLTTWTRLPDVLPMHIAAARCIQKRFTGNLTARVETHPPFPGVEKHYLRAQIARISHTTLLAPKDMYTTDAPDEEEEEENEKGERPARRFEVRPYEEVPPLNPQEAPDADDPEAIAPVAMWFHGYKNGELLEPKNWVHVQPQLLAEGRATKFKPEEDEAVPEDEAEEEGAAPEHVEWIHPFLSDVSHDAPLNVRAHSKADLAAWATRKAASADSDRQRVYLARSLLWPGAYCYAVCEDDKPGATVQNLYVGNGLKSRVGAVFAPPLPPLPAVEFPARAKLMRDCTRDDELEFEPAPPKPVVKGEEDEEAEEE